MTERAISSRIFPRINIPIPFRLVSIRLFGVIAADLIRFWMIPFLVSLIVLTLLLIDYYYSDFKDGSCVAAYQGLLGVVCFIAGLVCINDDRERGTLRLLRTLPMSARAMLFQKVVSAAILVIIYMAASEIWRYLVGSLQWDVGSMQLALRDWFITSLGDYTRSNLWNFGTEPLLSVAQIFCLVMLGLGAGAVYKDFVYSTFMGLTIYVCWYIAWMYAFRFLESGVHTDLFTDIMIGQQILLGIIAGFVFVRSVGSGIFHSAKMRTPASQDVEKIASNPYIWRLPWEHHASPYQRRLCIVTLLFTITITVIAGYLAKRTDSHDYWVFLLLPSAVIGISLFSKEELSAITGLLYVQPVSRAALLNERFWPFIIYVLIGLAPLVYLNATSSMLFLLPTLAIGLGTAFLAALARLFFRNPILPLFLVGVIVAFTIVLILATYQHGPRLPSGSPDDFAKALLYMIWYSIIMAGLPFVALKIAFQKTNLLSLGERARSAVGFSALYCIAAIGALLISALPDELFWLIANSFNAPFGLISGGAGW